MILRVAFFVFALGAFSVCQAQPSYKTGSYTERTTLVSLAGDEGAGGVADILEANHEIEFQVYVPESYDPSAPAGLLVYVSPIDWGGIPDTWKKAFDRRNMIWVSVNGSGNTKPPERRIAEAKVSPAFIRTNYEIDPKRIYISGMSGGGQISSIVAPHYPDLFRGGIFLCGVNPWSESAPDPWIENPPENLDAIKENRYVFISGTEDFKLAAVARAYRLYKKAGINSSKLIVIQDMGHELPDAENFDRALEFLDID